MDKDNSYQTYLFSYRFNGSEYGFDIIAQSQEEAKQRLSAMGLARYDGVLRARIPVRKGLWSWLRKIFH